MTKDAAEPPLAVLVSLMVVRGPNASTFVDHWRETKDTTFGTATRHLRGTAATADALPFLELFGNYQATATFDVWIDSSSELRRVRWSVKGQAVTPAKPAKAGTATTVPAAVSRRGVDLTLSADYRRRNVPLSVSTPTNVDELANIRKIIDKLNAQQA